MRVTSQSRRITQRTGAGEAVKAAEACVGRGSCLSATPKMRASCWIGEKIYVCTQFRKLMATRRAHRTRVTAICFSEKLGYKFLWNVMFNLNKRIEADSRVWLAAVDRKLPVLQNRYNLYFSIYLIRCSFTKRKTTPYVNVMSVRLSLPKYQRLNRWAELSSILELFTKMSAIDFQPYSSKIKCILDSFFYNVNCQWNAKNSPQVSSMNWCIVGNITFYITE